MTAKEKPTNSSSVRVTGQGVSQTPHMQQVGLRVAQEADFPSKKTLVTAGDETHGHSASGGGGAEVITAWPSQPSSPKDFAIVDQVMSVNRSLVQQIDALRLRLVVDSRKHDASHSALVQQTQDKLELKEAQVTQLKEELRAKEHTVQTLTQENQQKRAEIGDMQHTINALRQDVEQSKAYVEDIQHSLNTLKEEREKLASGAAYKEKEELIQRLTSEVAELRANLTQLEREVSRAKVVVTSQASKLRLLDHSKHNLHVQFKDELARATLSMRHQVEQMREVMRGQWEEMRALRQQNEDMRTDIKVIKSLLQGDAPRTEQAGPHFNMGALKPSLPALSTNTRRPLPGKKKPMG